MASLKNHLIRELAEIVSLTDDSNEWNDPCTTLFLLSGKEPFYNVRRMVENEVISVSPEEEDVVLEYRECFIWPELLKTLMLKWARKLSITAHEDWLRKYHREGFLKVLCENKDIKELSVDGSIISNWAEVFKMFPKLVSLHLTPVQFDQMVLNAPNALAGLEEIGFNFGITKEGGLAEACVALSTHHTKYPSLKVVRFEDLELVEVHYPDASVITAVPSVKHLKVAANHEYSSFDISFLTTLQKLFPTLETFVMDVEAELYEEDLGLDELEQFYQAFQSLTVGFSIQINCREEFTCFETDGTELREFLATKGTVTEDADTFIVKTCLPGKELTREVKINCFNAEEFSDEADYYNYEDYDDDDSDSESF
uniref:F-box domain-containing protein n=1 Tax=Panagrellus redivivus TaxID=6233 RepID=A0A7E4WAQ9_PANRE